MSPLGAMTMPPGVFNHAEMAGPLTVLPSCAPMTSRTAVAASCSMNVPVPTPTIIRTKMSALRMP